MDLIAAIEGFANFLLKYFIVLAAAGALAMAFVELFKKVHDERTRFHAGAVTVWFADWPGAKKAEAFGELLHLAAGVPKEAATCHASHLIKANGKLGGVLWLPIDQRNAAFAQELERMMACFQDSADLALTAPQKYEHFYDFISEAADDADRASWKADAATPPSAVPNPDEIKARAERYQRLRQGATRKLDAFQMFTGMRWVNKQQFWANIIGIGVLLAAFAVTGIEAADWPLAAGFSVLGGMLAPVAKDVVVALQQVRQPRP